MLQYMVILNSILVNTLLPEIILSSKKQMWLKIAWCQILEEKQRNLLERGHKDCKEEFFYITRRRIKKRSSNLLRQCKRKKNYFFKAYGLKIIIFLYVSG